MSGLFGSGQGHAVATQATRANGIQVQASSFGRALPIVYGRSRINGQLIWYGDFQAVEHKQQVGKGGGSVSTSYTYSSSFAVALCEGPIQRLGTIWKGSGQTTLSDLQATLMTGAPGQAPWSHWSGAAALNYPYVAYVACLNLQLGSTPTVPNLNWEVYGLLPFNAAGGIYDAEPSAILNDLLTNPQHGAGWAYLGDLSLYRSYCAAMGIFISPVIEQENTALQHINDLLTITNSTAVWSNGQLKIVPYSDQAASGNGYTYTPPITAVAALGPDQLIEGVTVDRKPLADLYNTIRLEYLDASNNYVTTVAEAKDQSDIDARSVRSQQTITAHAITNAQLATQVAYRILNRQLYVRNTYRFKVPITQIALEPMDVVTLSDPLLGLVAEPVRITQIEENGDGTLSIEAEEFPAGVAEAASYAYEPLAGYVPDSERAPDATQPPVFFRAPQWLVDSPEIWVGIAGAGPNWGGAHVWLSWDGNSYTHVGTVYRGSRYGVTKNALPAGSDPDTTNSVTLELYGDGQLNGASTADADRFATLVLIDQELISYSATRLNQDGSYTLGPNYIRRGAYNTAIASHQAGAPWIRVDDHVWRFGFDPADAGKTIYVKFQAFNLFGGGLQDLSTVAPYTYVIGAAQEIPDVPPVPTNFTAASAANGVKLSWTNPNPAAVGIVSVEYSSDNATWTVLGQTNGERLDHNFSGNATYYYRARARSPAFLWSAYTPSVSAAGGSLDYVTDGTTYGRTVQTALTSGQVDMTKVGVINKTADQIAETAGRKWAAQSGADVTASNRQSRNWLTDGAEGPIVKQSTAPASPYDGQLWTDTSSTPNVLKRWNASLGLWVKVGVTNQDELPDGTTYGRPLLARLNGGRPWIDFSEAINLNRTADQIAETAGRKWAAQSGADVTASNRQARAWLTDGAEGPIVKQSTAPASPYDGQLWTDTSSTPNVLKRWNASLGLWVKVGVTNQDELPDGTTYGRPLLARLNGGRPWIDFSEAINLNRTADQIAETAGRKWAAQSGADVTASNRQARAWLTDGAEGPIVKQSTAPASPYDGQLWTDTSSTPNVLKRWNASLGLWVKVGVTNQDELPDGTTYGRPLLARLNGGRPWIDFSEAINLNRTADQIAETAGRKWAAESGAVKNYTSLQYRPANLANLVLKPDFEDGQMGLWTAPPQTTLAVVSVTGQSFTKALQATASGLNYDVYENNFFAVKPGDTYFFGGWLNTAGSTTPAYVAIWFKNAAGSFVGIIGASLAAGSGWTYVSGKGTVPAGAAYGRVEIGWPQAAGDVILIGPQYRSQFEQGAEQTTGKSIDILADGTTYGRTVQTALTSGQPDLSKSGVINKTADQIAETAGRKWAAESGAVKNYTSLQYRPANLANLVLKPDFEDGQMGLWTAPPQTTLAVVSVTGQSFTKALQATASGLNYDVYENNFFAVKPGDTYFFGGWLNTAGSTTPAYVAIWFKNAAGSFVGIIGASLAAGSGWTYVSGKGTVPAGAAYGRVEIGWPQAAGDVILIGPQYRSQFEQGAEQTTGKSIDILADGTTYGRTVQTALTSGQVDMTKVGVINKTADQIAETAGRKWAAESGAQVVTGKSIDILADGTTYGRTVQAALTSGQPDLSKSGVINKTLDNVANTATRKAVSAVDANGKALIDFSQGGHNWRGSTPLFTSNVSFSYTSTTSSITISWSSFTIYWNDGTTTAVSSGQTTVTGLSANTTYYFYPYYDTINSSVNVGSAYTAASYTGLQLQIRYDHVPLTSAAMTAATPASGGGGGGGGGGCLHETTPLNVRRGSREILLRADAVAIGDFLPTPDGWQPVQSLALRPHEDWVLLCLDSGATLIVTPTQPFRTIAGEWVRASQLVVGQELEGESGVLRVRALSQARDRARKVIIGIPAPHAFYCAGAVLHNGWVKP
ncbi:MAG: phage tail protein [Sinobacteraceae bacterium]|nr:phage tail protein [Nevskiaceae bacterium]